MGIADWWSNSGKSKYAWGDTEKYIRQSFKHIIEIDAYCQQLYETLPSVMAEDLKAVSIFIEQALNNRAGLDVPASFIPELRKRIEEYSLSRWYLQLEDKDKEHFALHTLQSPLKTVNSSMLRLAGLSTAFSHILRDMLIEHYQRAMGPEFVKSVNNRIQQYTVACMMTNNYKLVLMHAEQTGIPPTEEQTEEAKKVIVQKKEYARKLVTGDFS